MEKAIDQVYMLTTLDNPFDPFDEFSSWFDFDLEKGHFTCSRLARIAELNPEMTEKEKNEAMQKAIDFIIKYDLEDKYIKVQEKQNATATNA